MLQPFKRCAGVLSSLIILVTTPVVLAFPALTLAEETEFAPVEPSPVELDLDLFPIPPAYAPSPSIPPVPSPPPPASPGVSAPQPVAPLRLVISLSQRRVTVFQGSTALKSYPVAIGRPGWETPVGKFQVKQLIRNPTWKNPFKGDTIKGGHPDNPLGKFWIGFWTDGKNWVGMHGTPNPESVGRAASHGCVRMYNKDIAELFAKVQLGTPVTVVK